MPEDKILKPNEILQTREIPQTPEVSTEKVEQIPLPEIKTEKIEKKIEEITPREGEGELGGFVRSGQAIQTQKDREEKIEKILANDLAELYMGMTPDQKQDFKRVGEETAQKINELMSKTKVGAKKIVDLIRKWLSMIPGVNKFFLEQETKIKVDEIMKINNEQK